MNEPLAGVIPDTVFGPYGNHKDVSVIIVAADRAPLAGVSFATLVMSDRIGMPMRI